MSYAGLQIVKTALELASIEIDREERGVTPVHVPRKSFYRLYHVTHKICPVCGDPLSVGDFNQRKASVDGRQRECRKCFKLLYR